MYFIKQEGEQGQIIGYVALDQDHWKIGSVQQIDRTEDGDRQWISFDHAGQVLRDEQGLPLVSHSRDAAARKCQRLAPQPEIRMPATPSVLAHAGRPAPPQVPAAHAGDHRDPWGPSDAS